jgi:hypothetical protein
MIVKNYQHHQPPRHHHHQHRQRPHFVVLTVKSVSVLIPANKELHMATTYTIGHTLTATIRYLDQNRNPMLVTPNLDAVPVWSNANPDAETLSVSPDGLSVVASPVAPGLDTISLMVVSGGQTFSATLDVEVDAAPQVLSFIEIVPAIS